MKKFDKIKLKNESGGNYTKTYRDVIDIVVVSDYSIEVQHFVDILSEKCYKVRMVNTKNDVIEAIKNLLPNLIIIDVSKQEIVSYDVFSMLKSNDRTKSIPIIALNTLSEMIDKTKIFSIGAADYITKPFNRSEIYSKVNTHITIRKLQFELEEKNKSFNKLVNEKVLEISNAQLSTILAMTKLAESRDDDTGKHIERIQSYVELLSRYMSLKPKYREKITKDFIYNIVHSSPLHDIGKVAISDNILLKPDKLTDTEFNIMKKHTVIGSQNLISVMKIYPQNLFVKMGIDISRSHHERWDGRGYPDGLRGEQIPMCARIMAIADVYDALRSERVYKKPISHAESAQIMSEQKGTHFDPEIFECFMEIQDEFDRINVNKQNNA